MSNKEIETEKNSEKETSGTKENSTAKNILGTIAYIAGVCIFVFLILHFVGQRTVVNGNSMDTTLANGQNLVMDKLSYRFHDPKRYDIIIFPYKYEEDTYYIKRIIGLPGEHVRIDDSGNIYINGKVLKESYGREVIQDPGIARDEITLGEGEYFVLGDNRNNSSDSRDPSVGIIQKKDIIGRAWLQIYPFDEFGFIRHQ